VASAAAASVVVASGVLGAAVAVAVDGAVALVVAAGSDAE
jgi:hypothetical protein